MLAELFKAKGDPRVCDNSRGIFITDTAGKQWHNWARGTLVKYQNKYVSRSTQFGDTNHAGTDFCSHAARSYWAWLESQSLSGFTLFVDIAGAFDAVVRRFVTDNSAEDLRVARAWDALSWQQRCFGQRFVRQGMATRTTMMLVA